MLVPQGSSEGFALHRQAEQVLDEVLARVANLEQLAAAAASAGASSSGVIWDPASLGSGFAGLALLHVQVARRRHDEELLTNGGIMLRRAVAQTTQAPLASNGLFHGAAGLAFVLNEFADADARYAESARRFQDKVAHDVLETTWSFSDVRAGPSHAWDLISGLAGTLVQLATTPRPSLAVLAATDHVAHRLSFLATKGDPSTTFFVPPALLPPGGTHARLHPLGVVDLGMAHGVTGVLSALSVAALSGRTSLDLREPVARLEGWLSERLLAGGDCLALGSDGALVPSDTNTRPKSWCRGSTGVQLTRSAADRFLGTQPSVPTSQRLDRAEHISGYEAGGADICHGLGGSLLSHIATSIEERDSDFNGATAVALDHLLKRARPDSSFIFDTIGVDGNIVQDPTLLSGAAGTALVLDACLSPIPPRWPTLFGAVTCH